MGFESNLFFVGEEAEITVLDTNKEWIFGKEHIQSRSKNSPFYGESLIGQVVITISRGQMSLI
jgi:dihydroorotase